MAKVLGLLMMPSWDHLKLARKTIAMVAPALQQVEIAPHAGRQTITLIGRAKVLWTLNTTLNIGQDVAQSDATEDDKGCRVDAAENNERCRRCVALDRIVGRMLDFTEDAGHFVPLAGSQTCHADLYL